MDVHRIEMRTEFKDLNSGSQTQHIYAEVVMVDQAPQGGVPMLYQLKKDRLTPYDSVDFLRQQFISLPHPAFSELGNIQEINMTNKIIHLTDGNVVSYKYMILVAGADQKDEAGTALHTLKEAMMMDFLNLKEKILKPRNFLLSGKTSYSKETAHSFSVPNGNADEYKNLEKLACDKLNDSNQTPSFNLTPSHKKLCFLQM